MGLGDIMGVRLQLEKDYTIEELYEKIKYIPFEAGHPVLVKQGSAKLIVWPQMDCCNQIQILGKNGKFNCFRSAQPAGLQKETLLALLNTFTGGLTSIHSVFGKNRKYCEALAKKTGEQINALRL